MILKTHIRAESLNRILGMYPNKKKAYKEMCYWEVRRYTVPKKREKVRKKIIYTHYYPVVPMDKDNLTGGLKYVQDALTNYGLIYDDNEKWVETKVQQVKGNKYALDIEIYDI